MKEIYSSSNPLPRRRKSCPMLPRVFILITCLFSVQAKSNTLGLIASYSQRNIGKDLYRNVQIALPRKCQDDPKSYLIYGNDRSGFYRISSFDPISSTVKLLPLEAKNSTYDLYCLSDQSYILVNSIKLQGKVPKMFDSIIEKHPDRPFSKPFHMGIGSLPYISEDFADPEGRMNIGFVYLMNRFGEMIWTYMPGHGEKMLANEISLEKIKQDYVITSSNYWEIFNPYGEILHKGKICQKDHQCGSDRPRFVSTNHNQAFIAFSKDLWKRSNWKDWIHGPQKGTATRIGKIHFRHSRLEFSDRIFQISNLKSFHYNDDHRILVGTNKLIFSQPKKETIKLKIEGILDAVWSHRKSKLFMLISKDGKSFIEEYKLVQGKLNFQKRYFLQRKTRWHRASMRLDQNTIYIYAVKSSPNRFETRSIPSDIYIEYDLTSKKVKSEAHMLFSFYSQSLGILPLEAPPGTSYIGSEIESI